MRYIEIDSIIEQIKSERCERCTNHRCALCDIDEVLILLEEADDADVVEVKHGKWKIKIDEYDCEYMMCSVCKEEFYPADADTVDTTPNYCPNCGAKMDERKEK